MPFTFIRVCVSKEFNEQTGNYYYGARYYDPKLSIFIGVDPLAEMYPGYSSYAYCLNNPVRLVDPDGMQGTDPPLLSGISDVSNVLAGKKWIDYRSNIVRTTTLLGFEVNRTSRHEQCADYSRLQVEQGGGDYTAVGSKSRIDMYVEKGGDKSKFDLQKGINTIIENLNEGKAVWLE